MARGRARSLAAHALVVPARPGGLRGGAGRVGSDDGRGRRGGRGRVSGPVAPDAQCGLGRPCPLEHARLPSLLGRGGPARGRPDGRPALDLGVRPTAQGAQRGGDRAAAGRRGGDRPAGAARPRAARGALRHRRPGERGGRPQPGRRGRGGGGQRPAAAARARQGEQGAGRAARGVCPRRAGRLAVAPGPPADPSPRSGAGAAMPRRCSSTPGAAALPEWVPSGW